ncbi:MAG: hypothetical protein KBA79_07660 [Candidatus Cloacimonetes bacterium]|nr:hypothetical protein [Candidatus Cloacimonadota bacterium]
MDKRFIRPLLIVLLAVLLLVFIGPSIPVWENEILPIKPMDIISSVLAAPDTTSVSQEAVKLAEQAPTVEELGPLDQFAAKLQALKSGKNQQLRIAYFGDSIIEGDLVSGRLRKNLQDFAGGNGVGLVGMTSIVNKFRKTIIHDFSTNWEAVSFMSKSSTPLGIMGHTFIPRSWQNVETTIIPTAESSSTDTVASDSSATETVPVPKKVTRKVSVSGPAWVQYQGVNTPGGAASFEHIRLFYSQALENSSVRVIYDGGEARTVSLSPGNDVQVLDLSPAAPVKKLRLEFSSGHPIHVYGVSFDAPTGVYVDNISIRGYSGMYFNRIPGDLLRGFQRALNYDLVILQYGENVSNARVTDYDFYRKGMVRSIKHLQDAMPGVPFLIISAHDRSIRKDMGYSTSPDIPILIKAQSEAAQETGSAFWNLFAEMGGMNSMPSWVNASPALAGKDYTHFTIAGANKVGEMLSNLILSGSKAVSE